MYEITAICKTETCQYLDKPSIFISNAIETQCGQCGNMMETEYKEVIDGTAENPE